MVFGGTRMDWECPLRWWWCGGGGSVAWEVDGTGAVTTVEAEWLWIF